MVKFKVGDKVRILDVSKISDAILLGFETGGIYDVIGLDECECLFISSGKAGILLPEQELQYIEKVKNNQRIAALEKEIAELRPLKEKIEHLEKAVQQYFAVPGEPSTVEDKPKTPNQQRAEIIEKAKEFTKEIKDSEFIVNEPKRTIVLFTRFPNSTKISRRIIVKCHPDDVFNSHIGKAIALGRALRKDVSEFENAVQPTEVVVGMVIQDYYKFKEEYITEIDNSLNFEYINEKIECYRKGVLNHNSFNARILNDTNAIYGGGE